MAEYIKFRLTAAKVSVSMAFLALLGGIAEKAAARPASPAAAASSQSHKLNGLSSALSANFAKIERSFTKIETGFAKIEKKLLKIDSGFVSLQHKIDSVGTTFLKITDATQTFLKITDANRDFLKVTDAAQKFLKIDAANNEFLKITDAAQKFLKIDGTAANASELGGLTPDSFVQGHANVVTAGTLIPLGQASFTPLLRTPDGRFSLGIQGNSDQVVLNFTNNTDAPLLAVYSDAGGSQLPAVQDTLGPGTTPITLRGQLHQFHLQVFPSSNTAEALTLTLSTAPAGDQKNLDVVSQMLIGLL